MELLRNPCILRGYPKLGAGTKSEVAASSLPSRGPTSGRNCYATPAFSRVPNAKRGDKIRSGYLTPAFSGAHKWAELLRNPCILKGPQSKGDKIISGCLIAAISGAQKGAESICNPCILGSPQTMDMEVGNRRLHIVLLRASASLSR